MNTSAITNGVWPTMVTPFKPDGAIDEHGLRKLVDWYIACGVHGLFAVCQSSEMFYLSLAERVRLARKTVKIADGRVPVISAGVISSGATGQQEEIAAMASTGVEAVVLLTNSFASDAEPDDIWKQNLQSLLDGIPADVRLGLYECPYPYKRVLTPDVLSWVIETNRFLFLKDTCSDPTMLHERLTLLNSEQSRSELKLFNANSATLLETLRMGAAGFSGVMANFHPDLYVWLCENWSSDPDIALTVQSFLGTSSLVEHGQYPANAKYSISLEHVEIGTTCRKFDGDVLTEHERLQVRQIHQLAETIRQWIQHQSNGRPF